MSSFKVFHSTWALQQLPISLKLLGAEWRFLICVDGKTPTERIQRRLGLTQLECETVVRRLTEIGLIVEADLSLEEFARTTVDHPSTTSASEPVELREHLLRVSQTAASAPAPVVETPPPAFTPLQKPSPPPPSTMSLQDVIQFILNHHDDATAGHFATYQVFMGIGTPLLKRNGITSLRFQDDRIITDPELQKAISESIERVLKVPYKPGS